MNEAAAFVICDKKKKEKKNDKRDHRDTGMEGRGKNKWLQTRTKMILKNFLKSRDTTIDDKWPSCCLLENY